MRSLLTGNLLGDRGLRRKKNRGPDTGPLCLTSSWQREMAPLAGHHLRAQQRCHNQRIQPSSIFNEPTAPAAGRAPGPERGGSRDRGPSKVRDDEIYHLGRGLAEVWKEVGWSK